MRALGILGPGALGRSLAQWAALCGLQVRLFGRNVDHARRGTEEVVRRWGVEAAKGRLSQEARDQAQTRLHPCAFGPEGLEGLDILLEAVPEEAALKAPLLRQAATWAPEDMLFLSGTSSLPIGGLARDSGLVGRLMGFHLFVPVPRMHLVELITPEGTPDPLIRRARSLAEHLGKRIVSVQDQPGFAAARLALAQGLEAMRLVEAGVASPEDLDAIMTLGYGHPTGPLELSDRIGLDLRLRIAEGLHRATGDPRFQVPRILEEKVAQGDVGRRSGRGFYVWDASGNRR